jgi:hypothetical protein
MGNWTYDKIWLLVASAFFLILNFGSGSCSTLHVDMLIIYSVLLKMISHSLQDWRPQDKSKIFSIFARTSHWTDCQLAGFIMSYSQKSGTLKSLLTALYVKEDLHHWLNYSLPFWLVLFLSHSLLQSLWIPRTICLIDMHLVSRVEAIPQATVLPVPGEWANLDQDWLTEHTS